MKNIKQISFEPYKYYNTPYSQKQLSTSVLISGQRYQRKVRMNVVKNIVSNFDPKLLDEVVVSFRGGKFYVIDGQHRIVALKMLNGGLDCTVNCKVITGLTYEQEAELYERLDESKKRLSVSDVARTKLEAKNDPDILNIKKILDSNGIEWEFSGCGGCAGNGKLSATRAVINAYKMLGLAKFSQMMRLINLAWRGSKQSLNMYIISGVACFIKTYGSEINESHFVKVFSRVLPEDIIMIGKSDAATREMGLKYARVIWSKYNYKQRINQLDYKFNG